MVDPGTPYLSLAEHPGPKAMCARETKRSHLAPRGDQPASGEYVSKPVVCHFANVPSVYGGNGINACDGLEGLEPVISLRRRFGEND